MAIEWSVNKWIRNNLFGPPSDRSILRPYDNLGTDGMLRTRSS
jgi:hypothetical protein